MELIRFCITLIIVSFLLLACAAVRKEGATSQYNQEIVVGLIPETDTLYDEEYQFFIKNKTDGLIYLIYGLNIQTIWRLKYMKDYNNYYEFKKDVLNGNLLSDFYIKEDNGYELPCFEEKFKLDSVISESYKKMEYDSFRLLYCKEDEHKKLVFRKDYTHGEKLTIAYFLWQNGYYFDYGGISGDDYFILKEIPDTNSITISAQDNH